MPLDLSTREAVIWCPSCRTDKYEVHRVPADLEGVFKNVTVPTDVPPAERKLCVCGCTLERKQ